MRIFKYKLFKTAFIALSAVVILAGCEDDNDDITFSPTETLDAKLNSRSDLSLFKAAIEKARLTNFTKGGGPFTLFVPNDAAFNAIGINSAADLNLLDSNLLVQILTYHMQAGRRSYIEIPLGPNANMVTQGGLTQYASRKIAPLEPKAYINGVQIIESDIGANNGFIHVIDKVLFPPLLTTAQTLAANPNYARFAQAVAKTATSTTTNPLTFFAVDNATMVAAGYDSTTIANIVSPSAALTTLTGIIRYHVVARRIFSPDLVAGPLKTVQGGNIIIGGSPGNFTIKGNNNPTPFNIVNTDVITTTGVVFSVSGLLKP